MASDDIVFDLQVEDVKRGELFLVEHDGEVYSRGSRNPQSEHAQETYHCKRVRDGGDVLLHWSYRVHVLTLSSFEGRDYQAGLIVGRYKAQKQRSMLAVWDGEEYGN